MLGMKIHFINILLHHGMIETRKYNHFLHGIRIAIKSYISKAIRVIADKAYQNLQEHGILKATTYHASPFTYFSGEKDISESTHIESKGNARCPNRCHDSTSVPKASYGVKREITFPEWGERGSSFL